MAVQNPFFGKRDSDTFSSRNALTGMPSASNGFGSSPVANTVANTPVPAARTTPPASLLGSEDTGGSKLTVGPNIKLKGVEITDCDTLVVEGTVEATMNSRVIHIAEQGAFHGTAEIDIAEIHGEFDGTLTVRERLVIYGTGKVSGKIRYGKVVIEEGGELTGQIEAGTAKSTKLVQAVNVSSSAEKASASTKSASAGAGNSPIAMAAVSPSLAVA